MKTLEKFDPELYNIIKKEEERQKTTLELIASENFTSESVRECLGSVLTNKYSEGLPAARYYGGNEYIDEIENLCISRALSLFSLNDTEWGVNVQPYSGSVANLAAYLGIIKPGDAISGLSLQSGGHLTHGFETPTKKISHTSLLFKSIPYSLDENGFVNLKELEKIVSENNIKLIICGASAYSQDFDYKKFREIADKYSCYLLCDMSHISGFVATKEMNSPFEFCDIVTTTTHKTLRGPRSAMIFFRKELLEINSSVFPGLQGGPHNHQIAGVATQLLEASTPEFKLYIKDVKKNTQVLFQELLSLGYNIVSGGSVCHLLLIDLKNKGVSGSLVEFVCDLVNIAINKNTVQGDKSALSPSGIRIGTAAMTTRGLKDFKWVARVLDKCVNIAVYVKSGSSSKKLSDLKHLCLDKKFKDILDNIKKEVVDKIKDL